MEPFIGQITLFPIGYTPVHWADCDGRLIAINANTALFSLIGNAYGGDGKTNFAVPDLRGRAPLSYGILSGTSSNYLIAHRDGLEAVALTEETTPPHIHQMVGTTDDGTSNDPNNRLLATATGGLLAEAAAGLIYTTDQPGIGTWLTMSSLSPGGASKAHNNMQPSLVLRYCIALQGIMPQRPSLPRP